MGIWESEVLVINLDLKYFKKQANSKTSLSSSSLALRQAVP